MTPERRYTAAAHAMQSGVAADMETDTSGGAGATTPKHLRVGVNSAMADHSALAELLIAKGVFTHAEYMEALASGMEREAKRYQDLLSSRLGTKVTLG